MYKIKVNYFLLLVVLSLILFIGIQIHYNVSPQEGLYRFYIKFIRRGEIIISPLPSKNYGIIAVLDRAPKYGWTANKDLAIFKSELEPKVVETLGVHISELGKKPQEVVLGASGTKDGIKYYKLYIESYDGLDIPIMQFLPPDFDTNKTYTTIIVFSGHGGYNQVNFEKNSYQHAAALELTKAGYLVFTMENRGMGELSYLGSHLRIDAAARLAGGTWYGEIITDGLSLLEYVYNLKYVDKDRVGVAGVSSGGALSLFTAALDNRIKAAYVQGYFGSYKMFGLRTDFCMCNNIAKMLNVADMNDIAGLVAPRRLLVVNGKRDGFLSSDAKIEFEKLKEIYRAYDAEENVDFKEPDVGHEFSVDVALEFFNRVLK